MNNSDEVLLAKQLLELPNTLNEQINIDFLHLRKLYELRDRYGSGYLPQEKVKGGQLPHSPVTKIIDKIADLEREIDSELKEYDRVMEHIKKVFSLLEPKYRSLLKERNLNQKSISEIVENSEYFASSTLYTQHNRAMKRVVEIMKQQGLVENGKYDSKAVLGTAETAE